MKTKHQFDSGRPINSRAEDLLGRAKFSQKIADAVSNWKQQESLVLAIDGKWGNGKSSVKNMILDSLADLPSKKQPKIVEFNPWEWQSQNALQEAFFNELQIQLKKYGSGTSAKRASKKLKKYSLYLQVANTIFHPSKQFLLWILSGAGVFSFILSRFFPSVENTLFFIFLCLVLIASFTKILEKIINAIQNIYDFEAEQPLSELKKEISSILSNIENPIIVVIDDIDRLRKTEIQTLFQIIKANADFPNLIYLLFFQRDIIENSLSEDKVYSGSEYLEKIVQVSFSLPQIQLSRIHTILLNEVEKILDSEQLLEKFEIERWQNIFFLSLSNYFLNLRDVNRFLSTLTFQIGMLKTNNTFEVNPLDLIVLEVIRLYEPKIYEFIYANKLIFTSNPISSFDKSQRTIKQESIDAIIDLATNKDEIRIIIFNLFPNIRWFFEDFYYEIGESENKMLRICCPNFFNRYFQLHLSEEDISQGEIDKAVSFAGNLDLFKEHLMDLHQRNLLITFLSRVVVYVKDFDASSTVSCLTALFDIGDLLSNKQFLSDFTEISYADRIIHLLLEKEKNQEQKTIYIFESLKKTTGIFLPLYWINLELAQIEKRNKLNSFFTDQLYVDELKKIGIKIIHNARDNDSLANSKHLGSILIFWNQLENNGVSKTWVQNLIQNEEGILTFLKAFINPSYSYQGNHSYRISWNMELKLIENFTNLHDLKKNIEKINITNLTPEDNKAVEAFLVDISK